MGSNHPDGPILNKLGVTLGRHIKGLSIREGGSICRKVINKSVSER